MSADQDDDDDDDVPALVVLPVTLDVTGSELTSSVSEAVRPSPSGAKSSSVSPAPSRGDPVPLIILTGFLGAGKSSLIRHTIRHFSAHTPPRPVAVIQNETAPMGTEPMLFTRNDYAHADGTDADTDTIVSSRRETYGRVVELSSGCVCCSVLNDCTAAINALCAERRYAALFIECSGMTEPRTLIQQLWVDEELQTNMRLDSVVAVVDANLFQTQMSANAATLTEQILFADAVVINKTDQIKDDTTRLAHVITAVTAINKTARVFTAERGRVDVDEMMKIRAFSAQNTIDDMTQQHAAHTLPSPSDHLTLTSLTLESFGGRLVVSRLHSWLNVLLWETDDGAGAARIARMKGVLSVVGSDRPHFLQCVGETYDIFDNDNGREYEWPLSLPQRPMTRIIVIGNNINEERLQKDFDACFMSE